MKLARVILVLGLAASPMGVDVKDNLSPVTRVAELLTGLREQVEADHKKEEDLYESYVCWAKTVIGAKTLSNEKAQSRTDSLATYIADLDAGRIELTSERTDLEKEIAGLSDDIQVAEDMRAKENKDFLAAKDELTQAVAALTDAIAVLDKGTKGGSADTKVLFQISRRFLSPGDAAFLQRLFGEEVPDVDWKKLNRKADFKMKYEARSGNIQKTLKGLLSKFQDGLKDAEAAEKKAAETHKTLMTSKKDQLGKAQDAYKKMDVEGAARGLSKSEAQSEIGDLKTQMANDKKYIGQVEKSLAEKKKEWTERSKVRADEMKAISEAISVIHSDDARDLFKRSLSSQGYSLVQQTLRSSAPARRAAAALRAAARAAGDRRLLSLAALAAGNAPAAIKKVVDQIDKMLKLLMDEEAADLKTKESCEKNRATDTRTAATVSRDIDDKSDTISRLETEIEEIVAQVKEKEEEIAEAKEQLKEAKDLRDKENKEFLKADKDDTDAIALLEKATGVLKKFYSAQGAASFAQEPPEVVAGEAPPPPPATWDAPYKGKQDENKGVVAILELITEDVKSDQKKAKAAEDEAVKAFGKLDTETNKQIADLGKEVSDLNGKKGEKETKITDTKKARETKKGELDAVLKKLKDAAPGCDFFTVNFETRKQNRQLEMDGLSKAKAILAKVPAAKPSSLVQAHRHIPRR